MPFKGLNTRRLEVDSQVLGPLEIVHNKELLLGMLNRTRAETTMPL